ncbi:hypothetical protein GCM10022381_25310 [Leifsonia kafniensis]|uniref:Uncharacterized protein n=1 Tax=Leifsonia kafniensis TaxID=475957 RepID=A0ABP7KMI7_9MICO
MHTIEEADAAFVWIRPTINLWTDDLPGEALSIAMGDKTGIDVARVQAIEAAVPTILTATSTDSESESESDSSARHSRSAERLDRRSYRRMRNAPG